MIGCRPSSPSPTLRGIVRPVGAGWRWRWPPPSCCSSASPWPCRGGDQGLSTAATPPTATAPPAALEPTYVTPGLTAGDGSPVQIPPGGPIHWIGDAGEFEIQWEAQPFATKDHPKATDRFDGQDGLTFVVDREGDLEAQQALRARLTQQRDDAAQQLEQDPQNRGLRDQWASLTNNITELDRQTADLHKWEPIDGGRGDLRLSIRGSVGLDELRKVALGLRVRDARTTGSTPGLGPATSAATGSAPNAPSDLVPVSPLDPGAGPRPPVVVDPDGSSSGFRLVPPPLPDGVTPHGSPFDPGLTSADRARRRRSPTTRWRSRSTSPRRSP